jgi:hypothetical protein
VSGGGSKVSAVSLLLGRHAARSPLIDSHFDVCMQLVQGSSTLVRA